MVSGWASSVSEGFHSLAFPGSSRQQAQSWVQGPWGWGTNALPSRRKKTGADILTVFILYPSLPPLWKTPNG